MAGCSSNGIASIPEQLGFVPAVPSADEPAEVPGGEETAFEKLMVELRSAQEIETEGAAVQPPVDAQSCAIPVPGWPLVAPLIQRDVPVLPDAAEVADADEAAEAGEKELQLAGCDPLVLLTESPIGSALRGTSRLSGECPPSGIEAAQTNPPESAMPGQPEAGAATATTASEPAECEILAEPQSEPDRVPVPAAERPGPARHVIAVLQQVESRSKTDRAPFEPAQDAASGAAEADFPPSATRPDAAASGERAAVLSPAPKSQATEPSRASGPMKAVEPGAPGENKEPGKRSAEESLFQRRANASDWTGDPKVEAVRAVRPGAQDSRDGAIRTALDFQAAVEAKEPAASQPLKPAAPRAELVFEIADKIRLQIQNGGSEIKVQLKPETLGRIEIRAESGINGVTARILTESAGVRQYFENNLHVLQQSLQEQGLKVDRIDFVLQDGFDGHFTGQQQAGETGAGRQGWNGRGNGAGVRTAPVEEVRANAATISAIGPNSTFHTIA